MRQHGYYIHESGSATDDYRRWAAGEYEVVPEDKEKALVASHYGVRWRERVQRAERMIESMFASAPL